MKKPSIKKNAKSGPKGKVHAVSWVEDNGNVHPECGYQSWTGDYWGHKIQRIYGWERTDEPVTCKTCLRVMGEIKNFTVTRKEAAIIRTVLESSTRFNFLEHDRALKAVRKWDLSEKDGGYE